ncbi:MAG: hypothetical protein WCO61_02440 [Alphaproteobacteria bacterium]
MMILLSRFGTKHLSLSIKGVARFALILSCFLFAHQGTSIAQNPDALKKARQQCSRLAEKIANTRKLENNTVQSMSNYNLDKDTCLVQIEVSQLLQSAEPSETEKRHRQVILMNATTNDILAIAMWEEPKGLRVGHIYDPKYEGPRDDYEKIEAYMRKKMALNVR